MIEVTASSQSPDPVVALSEALWQAGRELIGQGGMPFTVKTMRWTGPEPAVLSPRRREVDLALREAFGGFRPRITVRSGERISVTIHAEKAAPFDPKPVWRGFSVGELAREYSPRSQVPDLGAVFRQWARDGASFLQGHQARNIFYGAGRHTPDQTFDLFLPRNAESPPPVWIFIHGGYWQAADKDQHAQFCAGMLKAGFAVANLNYTLAPTVSLQGITRQIARALRFIARNGASLGVNGAELHVSGHSAGGHLAAYAALDPACPPLRSALPLSGLFDLTPMSLLPMGPILGLKDAAMVENLSPICRSRPVCRIGIAVGGKESAEFIWQSQALATAWGAPVPLIVDGANHFTLLDGLNGGALLDLALATARG